VPRRHGTLHPSTWLIPAAEPPSRTGRRGQIHPGPGRGLDRRQQERGGLRPRRMTCGRKTAMMMGERRRRSFDDSGPQRRKVRSV